MFTTLSVVLLLFAGWLQLDEPTDPYTAPGDGLGLATNRPQPTPPSPSPLPLVPFTGAGLGGLAALAGVAAGARTGSRKEEDGGAFDGDLEDVWGLDAGDAVLLLDPRGDGLIAVRVGPPDADYVAILVPGTGVDLGDTADYVERTRNIQQAAEQHARGRTASVIFALPFDAPDQVLTNPNNPDCACNDRKARQGAVALTEFVEGLDLDARRVTVIGHSYGSTVVGAAFAHEGLGAYADTPVFLGSPGVLVHSAEELDAPGEVYAAQAPLDFIDEAGAWPILDILSFWSRPTKELLIHGLDPTAPQFGATRVPAGGVGHSSYFSDPTTLRSLGLIITGNDPLQ